jgi:hypothetical protein
MTSSGSYAEQVAANMLNRHGLAAIWQLHMAAAAAYRRGERVAAMSITEIAEAAEREWLRRRPENAP